MQPKGQPSQAFHASKGSSGSSTSQHCILDQEHNYSSDHIQPPSSSSLEFSDALLSQSPIHTCLQSSLFQTHHQASSSKSPGGASGNEFMNLHQMLAFGMGSCNPRVPSQLWEGRQERSNLIKGEVADNSQAGQESCEEFMSALALLQKNIEHLQTLVRMIAQGGQLTGPTTQQQMKAAAGMATVISQLVAVAAGSLPEVHQQSYNFPVNLGIEDMLKMDVPQQNFSENSLPSALAMFSGNCPFSSYPGEGRNNAMEICCSVEGNALDGSLEFAEFLPGMHQSSHALGNSPRNHIGMDLVLNPRTYLNGSMTSRRGNIVMNMDNHSKLNKSQEMNSSEEDPNPGNGLRDEEDEDETEILPVGSYDLIELDAIEILAEHTHFCEVCGKGFKRDANLRMHMRGHGDEYKTAAALARPDKFDEDPSRRRLRRYSCPYSGCKRNKKHKKFLPLKTMLCVKNHYRRSHCPKMLTCNKCKVKSFSVLADLKTHEKHCGKEKWQCSCGTTFSRKDKLLGHVVLFIGHTPVNTLTPSESPGICEKVKNVVRCSRKSVQGKVRADFGAGNVLKHGSGHDWEAGADMKPENVLALLLAGKDSTSLEARGGENKLHWRGSNKLGCGIGFSDSEQNGGISGSQTSTLSSLKQAEASSSTGPSSLQGLFANTYEQDPHQTNKRRDIL